ncbi:hypothetical protein BG004_004890 [Podila humilis]|nr:hypothetical protein BG004_004890 [Podila humilis]
MAALPRSARHLLAVPCTTFTSPTAPLAIAASRFASTSTKSTAKEEASAVLPPKNEYTTGLTRLREHYQSTVQDDLMVLTYSHSFKPKAKIPEGVRVELKGNRHIKPAPKAPSATRVPELVKIDVHCMMKEALVSKYNLLSGFMAIQSITGEMPELINSKKGVHPWKLRAGNPIGCKVTLKGDKMYQFMDKLVEVVLPRLKEWPGLPESAGDATGNIGMGFPPSAMSLFPEIENNFDMFPRMTGFDVTFTTTAATNLEARLLLSGFNMPFQVKNRSAPVSAAAKASSASSIESAPSA